MHGEKKKSHYVKRFPWRKEQVYAVDDNEIFKDQSRSIINKIENVRPVVADQVLSSQDAERSSQWIWVICYRNKILSSWMFKIDLHNAAFIRLAAFSPIHW